MHGTSKRCSSPHTPPSRSSKQKCLDRLLECFNPRYLDTHRVERGAGRQEKRPIVRPAEGTIGRNLWCAYRPQMLPCRIEHPGAAWSAQNTRPWTIHLHAIRHTLFRR